MTKYSLFLMLVFSYCLFGQSLKYGTSGNFHRGSIAGVHDFSKAQFGGNLGVFAQFPLVENEIFDSAWLYLEPHVEFSTQGEKSKAENELQKFDNNYLAFALYLKYFFHDKGVKRNFFIFGGAKLEYLVSQNRTTSAHYEDLYYKYNLDSNINKASYGASFGAGFRISDHYEAFLIFDRGFSKIYPDNPVNSYNRLLGVGVNYYIKNN